MNSIEICEREKCCGCAACAQKCPVQAIEMRSDSEGFLYPDISDKCIDCQQCRLVCPVNSKAKNPEVVCDVYAVQLKDEKLLQQSTSGGVFILLAKYVLEKGGVVFGAAYDRNMVVKHTAAETMDAVFPMQGSKYVQSEIGDTYKRAEQYLKEERYVLFSGTPCQIEGLIGYLQKEYSNLITLDIICGGTPSPLLFREYLKHVEAKNHSKIFDYKFRDKLEYGCSHTTVIYEQKKNRTKRTVIKDREKNTYFVAFGKQAFVRVSCYDCAFGGINRASDFTCGGYFGSKEKIKIMGEDKGISTLIIHTEKGKKLFDIVKNDALWLPIQIEEAKEGNRMLYESVPMQRRCPEMYSYLNQFGYEKTAKKYFPTRKFAKLRDLIPLSVRRIVISMLSNSKIRRQ